MIRGTLTLLVMMAGCLAAASTAPAQMADLSGSFAAMNTAGYARPPIGHISFCRRNPAECIRHGDKASVALDTETWRELVEVNYSINSKVAPVTDLEFYNTEEYWTLPDAFGDCEDYVLLKRRELIERGWPSGALLITVVFDENNDGHAILIVRTDRGEFVLDNKTAEIKIWYDTPYRFVKRQSETDPMQWVSINDNRRMEEGVASIR